jgi:N-acetyl-anhydromuramyl-L-alanine amidase AmpD
MSYRISHTLSIENLHLVYIDKEIKNVSKRSENVPIDTIIVHSTASFSASSSINWFLNPESKVSAHFIIDKAGIIYHLVPIEKTAWHAGKCSIENANLRSIGIELVNMNNGIDPYPTIQIEKLISLILYLKEKYGIKYLYGHKEISLSGKTDPRGLDMNNLRTITGLKTIPANQSSPEKQVAKTTGSTKTKSKKVSKSVNSSSGVRKV